MTRGSATVAQRKYVRIATNINLGPSKTKRRWSDEFADLPPKKRLALAPINQQVLDTSAKLDSYIRLSTLDNARDTVRKWQMQIGNGLDEAGLPSDSVEIPLHMISPTQDDLIATIFPDPDNPGDDCAILAARNIDCDAINETILSRVTGAVTELLSADKLLDAHEEEGVARRTSDANLHHNYPIEYLNSLLFSGLPPHKLRLKIGCIVMLLRNLDLHHGLCNGVRLRVLEIGPRFLKCEIITGSNAGNIALLPRIALNPDDDKLPFQMQRLQFPIKLAYAITINKSQRQSFSRVGSFDAGCVRPWTTLRGRKQSHC
jgi:hypothetical protein